MSAPPLSRDRARRLRREETDAERRLWMYLRRHQLGVQFRRQHPIGPYIVDFCCVERLLIVECSPSAQVGQIGAIEEERVFGSS